MPESLGRRGVAHRPVPDGRIATIKRPHELKHPSEATASISFGLEHASGLLIVYLHDIGGPIAMRIETAHPERIAGLVSENFTMSVAGWNPDGWRMGAYAFLKPGKAGLHLEVVYERHGERSALLKMDR